MTQKRPCASPSNSTGPRSFSWENRSAAALLRQLRRPLLSGSTGIILITPWDTLLSVAKDHFPWLPVRLFLRDSYDTVGNLKHYQGRIAIAGAERDDIVPIRHAQALFEALPGDKKMWTIRGAGHNTWPDMVGLAWWKEITDFIEGKDK